MATTQQISRTLAILIWLTAPTLYLGIERYASRMFSPYYSYLHRFTSDLGIPYAYNDPDSGHLNNSWRAVQMNLNFAVNGFLFLVGQIFLLRATGQKGFFTARVVIAVLYCIGVILVAAVPGGPKEHESGNVRWHSIGAILAICGGNINSLLAGFATPADSKPVYRRICLLLGTIGIFGPGLYPVLGSWEFKGFWQRMSIYPTQAWEYSTAVSLIFELLQTGRSVKKD
ncbi:hypothetical protein PRZ48_010643 [Zasmidium cellare]|uniref:DUF998 domain-containing protein n=1 Tax=Zasmidium cellare TaxID=395010 RepID=A0ABR0E977_ZASCE|nr:hypothetical protein PRZ48_010643 [Zasmidium cellare]